MTIKNKKLRIIFMGTPEFAVPSLDILVENGYDIAAVVTAPDKPAGRGQELQMSDIKKYALTKNLKVLQPEKLKDESFLTELKSLNANLQIVVAFRMLPEAVWNMPELGTFNLHGSLLPQYRGAAPINRAIMNGEKETGVTTFFLKHEIDTGNIIFRESTPVTETDNAGTVYERLMKIGAQLVLKTVKAIETNCYALAEQNTFVKQGEILQHAPKIFRDDCKINWNWPAKKINDHIRGLSPYPAAFSDLKSKDGNSIAVKIFNTSVEDYTTSAPGTIQTDQKTFVKVAAIDKWLHLHELQIAGKKRMKADELLRGFKLNEEYHFV